MNGNAILLTNGLLDSDYAKTAHGLIRGSERFKILAVIDPKFNSQDAGMVTDGIHRNIPVFSSIDTAKNTVAENIHYAIVGVATKGGVIPPALMNDIKDAIRAGYPVISGLHQYLSEIEEIKLLAGNHQVGLIDIRKPKPVSDLNFWTGEIHKVSTPIVAVLGTDCALGKRTTTRFLRDACRDAGLKSEMIFTGQTGWLQDGKYGFIFDATLNDFVSGELEHALLHCVREASPDIIFVEGQAALLNPSGPCGSEFIVSGRSGLVVLQHAPKRIYYNGWEKHKLKIPPIEKNIAMIDAFGAKVIGITLNTADLSQEEAFQARTDYEQRLNMPVLLPLYEGVEGLITTLKPYVK